jgi:hypothetical protein
MFAAVVSHWRLAADAGAHVSRATPKAARASK